MPGDSAWMSASSLPTAKSVLAGPLAVSLVLHAILIALVFLFRPGTPPPSAPVYRVDLVAAPPGARAAGVVTPQPVAPVAQTTPIRPKTAPHEMPPPTTKAPPRPPTSHSGVRAPDAPNRDGCRSAEPSGALPPPPRRARSAAA